MNRSARWMVPVAAAVAMVVGMAGMSAQAQEKKAATGSVTGTVVDKDGKAVSGIEVHLIKPMRRGGPGGPGGPGGGGGPGAREQAAGQHEARPLQAEPGRGGPGGEGGGGGGGRPPAPKPVATATTDDAGKFEMKDVPVGDYMAACRDPERKIFGGARVTVEEGKTATVEIKTTDQPMRRGPGGPGGPGGGEGGGRRRGPSGEGGGQQPQ